MSVKITYQGKTVELPVLNGTVGPSAFDISNLRQEFGLFSFDSGFSSTASCASAITYVDGDKGELWYRGYVIQDLVQNCDFLETAYLLLNGELPSRDQQKNFQKEITYHTLVHEQMRSVYQGFGRDAHPMAIMVGVVGALSAFYHDSLDIHDPQQREIASYRLIAKMPNLAGMAYNYSIGHPFIYPKNNLKYSKNFLHMMFAVPSEDYQLNPIFVKALDRILILHADHEQNASTSTVRLAGSSQANPFACISAGIASLWGPSHGGANEAVIRMLIEIGEIKKIPEFIKKAKDPNDPFRLMGFGHRVYKNYDPRAQILRQTCYEVLDGLEPFI